MFSVDRLVVGVVVDMMFFEWFLVGFGGSLVGFAFFFVVFSCV